MKVIAHRGNDGGFKENTKEAILNCLKKSYVDGVEFDIRVTRDNKFVIHHNSIFEGKLIENVNLKQISKLDELESVLKEINCKKIIMIEIKQFGKKKKNIAVQLYKILKKYNLNYYICSFDYDFIECFSKKFPNIKSGLIIGLKLNLSKINNKFNFNSINYSNLDKITLKETFVWTVNSERQLDEIPKRCIIITDVPLKIHNAIY